MGLMDVSDISRMLAGRIDTLVPMLLPAAVRDGHEWRVGGIDGSPGRSMCIHRGGARAGIWADFSSSDDNGDALDLIAAVRYGGDKGKAVAFAKSWLGLDSMDPNRLKQVRAKAKAETNAAQAAMERDIAQRRKVAKAIWHEGVPLMVGDLVYQYLFGRGIDLAQLDAMPGAIRFRGSLDYPPSMNDDRRESYPAMVSAIINHEGAHVATHRTYLRDYSLGLVRKAPVRDAKLTLGSYKGGVIPIHKGISGKPLRQAPPGDKVILCEGIEDALTMAMITPEYRVLAAVAVSNFQNLGWLPENITDITLAADNDPETITDHRTGEIKRHPARIAVDAAVAMFQEQGRIVRPVYPPDGSKDFNDMIRPKEPTQGQVAQ